MTRNSSVLIEASRKTLVNHVKSVSRLTGLMPTSFHTGKEIALDLSPGKASPQSLHRFIKKISDDTKYPDVISETRSVIAELEFESTLRYVDIPISDTNKGDYTPTKGLGGRDEALLILNWLGEKKGVKNIIEIRIADSHYRPHNEEIIALAVRRFDVQILNWKRTDLSIDAILEGAPNVKELHLYSSGSWAALGHWVGADGVGRLKKVGLLLGEACAPLTDFRLMTARTPRDYTSVGRQYDLG